MPDQKTSSRIATTIATIALGVVVFVFMQLMCEGTLHLRESSSLFLFCSEYVNSYLEKGAPLLAFFDDFVAQFFYLRYAGAAIIAVLAVCEFVAWRWALRGSMWALLIALTDAAMFVTHEHLLGMPLGSISAAGMVRLFMTFDRCKSGLLGGFLMTSAATVGVMVIGLHATIGAVCAVVLLLFGKRKTRAAGAGVAVVVSLCAALIVRHELMLTFEQLALAQTTQQGLLYTTTAILAATLLSQAKMHTAIPVATAALAGCGIVAQLYSADLELSIYIDSQFYFGNHQNVQKALDKNPQTNMQVACYYRNLESARRGTLADDLLQQRQGLERGLFIVPEPKTSWFSIMAGYEAFALTGCATSAQHSAMLAGTFSPKKHSVRALEYLLEVNTACGDTMAAQKYARLLSKTLYHKTLRKRNLHNFFRPANDTLFSATNLPLQLRLAVRETHNAYALEYLLCYDLLKKRLTTFIEDLEMMRPPHLSDTYQQAILIVSAVQGLDPREWGVEERVYKDFVEYTRLHREGRKDLLDAKYRQTYWHYFNFADIKNQ